METTAIQPSSTDNRKRIAHQFQFVFAISLVFLIVLFTQPVLKINISHPFFHAVAGNYKSFLPPESDDVNKTGRYVTMCPQSLKSGRRLGNHLFNFAAMLHTAKLTGRRVAMVRVHPNGWLDRVFNVSITRVNNIDRDMCPCYTLGEPGVMTYDKNLKTLLSTNVTGGKTLLVCGFTQSWKYTVGVEAQLKHYLRPHESLSKAVDEYLRQVVPERWSRDPTVAHERVVIHIRTGDFTGPRMAPRGFTMPKIEYFRQAMQYVVQNTTISDGTSRHRRIQFIVVTESVDWCQKRLNLSAIVDDLRSSIVDIDLIYSIGKTAQFQFVLLTRGDITIITSGTFGWWGAWLANKTTIYYSNYPAPGTLLSKGFTREDYYPSHWTPFGGPWFTK